MKAQRKAERSPWEGEIEFLTPEPCQGQAVDIAPGGVGVLIPVALEPETPVEMKIFHGRLIIYGWVRWVEETPDGYRTGIQFREDDWSIIRQVHEDIQSERED